MLVVLLAIPAIAPLTYPGAFQTLGGLNAVYNLMDLTARLGNSLGWAPTFARGMDVLRGDGPLPYALAASPRLLGLSFLTSIKLIYALAFIFSGLGMFGLAQRVFKSAEAGLVAAVLYIYFPYHIAVIYVRGALGEAVAWALFPFALVAFARLRAHLTPRLIDYLPTVLVFAFLALTTPGLALLFAVGTILGFELFARWQGVTHPLKDRREWGVGLGLLIGAIPLGLALQFNRGVDDSYSFVPAFVYPFQFLTASWGAALPRGNYLDPFPFQLGIAALGLTLIALALGWRAGQNGNLAIQRLRSITWFSVLLALALLVLMLPWLAPLWDWTQATRLVEYPFELLGFVALLLSLAASSIVVSDRRFAQIPLLATLTLIPILAAYSYLAPEYIDFAPVHPPLALFNDGEVALLDAQIVRPVGPLRHGASVDLELEWQALRQVNHDYTVFVHAVDDSGKTWGGEDSKPQGGAMPTLKWPVGRVISDTHTIQIDLNGPPEGYHLEVGIYTVNGERAPTETGATEVWITGNESK